MSLREQLCSPIRGSCERTPQTRQPRARWRQWLPSHSCCFQGPSFLSFLLVDSSNATQSWSCFKTSQLLLQTNCGSDLLRSSCPGASRPHHLPGRSPRHRQVCPPHASLTTENPTSVLAAGSSEIHLPPMLHKHFLPQTTSLCVSIFLGSRVSEGKRERRQKGDGSTAGSPTWCDTGTRGRRTVLLPLAGPGPTASLPPSRPSARVTRSGQWEEAASRVSLSSALEVPGKLT